MAGSQFAPVWAVLQSQIDAGRLPGFVAAINHRGHTELHAAGTLTIAGDAPMRPDTIFRIASLSKLIGAVLALRLVQDGVFALEDPIAGWLPELAEPRVLRDPQSELDDTVPADRQILVEDLLKMTAGFGLLLSRSPLQQAMAEQGIAAGPIPPAMSGDEYLARLGSLPLAHQPGAGWLYHNGTDVLSVLLARATGRSAGTLLDDYLCRPLGLTSTAFHTTELDRLPDCYAGLPSGLRLFDPADGEFARPPRFETFAGGLVSTVPDYLTFLGVFTDPDQQLLDPRLLAMISADSLDDVQRASAQTFLGDGNTWGLNVQLCLRQTESFNRAGMFGWSGGSGTNAGIDPANQLTAVVFTQRLLDGPTGTFDRFWQAVYDQI